MNITNPETFNAQIKEIQSLVDDLIEVKNGKAYAKSGVSREQLSFAIAELEKVHASFELISRERESYFNDVTKHNKNVVKVQNQAMYLMSTLGSNLFPKWYKKFLGI